jgi:restriction system protein
MRAYEGAKARFLHLRDADLQPMRRTRKLVAEGDPEAVVAHFDLALRRLQFPPFAPRQWALRFDAETRTLLVEHQFRGTARMELNKIVQQSKGPVIKPASQTLRRSLVPKIHPAPSGQIAHGLAEADIFDLMDTIAVNGWVSFFERATGHDKRAYCSRLIAAKSALRALNVETVDFISAFHALRGQDAGETYVIVPITPSLRLNREDRRFIDNRATIDSLPSGDNLAAM